MALPPTPAARGVDLLDAAGARAGDEAAVAAGDTWLGLMERAAGHLARGVVHAGGHGYGLKVTIVVGRGNNGGDGWAAARRLASLGAQARVVAVDGLDADTTDEARSNRERWLAAGGRTGDGPGELAEALDWAEVALDALLGTGSRGAPRGPAADGVRALVDAHARGLTVVACDVPSGVSADDGSAAEDAVRAEVTVTFGGIKRGLVLHPGAAHAGSVVLGELGPGYTPGPSAWQALTPAGAAPAPLVAHDDKHARGRVLAVAGAPGMSGAAALTGTAALRAGAGLVTVLVPAEVRAEVAARSDAGVMVRGLEPAASAGAPGPGTAPTGEAGAGEVAADGLDALVAATDVVVAGPGLGTGGRVRELVATLRRGADRLVLDADALNVHRDDPAALAEHAGTLVLTPHARELARIGGGDDGDDAWAHRTERVPALAAALDATIVAKGPGTLVAAPDGRVWVCPLGDPALGSGGTGDVLAGMVGAAVATADDVPLAVARAVWWHAAAGVLAGARTGGRATATDLLDALPRVLARLAHAQTRAASGRRANLDARPAWEPWREALVAEVRS